MKGLIQLLIVLLMFTTACGKKTDQEKTEPAEALSQHDPRVEKLALLATELKSAAVEGFEISDEKSDELSNLFKMVLPETIQDLAGYEWELSCFKNAESKDLLFTVYLNRKIEGRSEQPMWFHIIYNPHMSAEDRENYGTDSFAGYKAIVSENAYIWLLVNNIEIRAIASSDDFKTNERIKSVMNRFLLNEIERL